MIHWKHSYSNRDTFIEHDKYEEDLQKRKLMCENLLLETDNPKVYALHSQLFVLRSQGIAEIMNSQIQTP